MHFSKQDILNTSKINRLNLINSITGIKPTLNWYNFKRWPY